MRNKLQNKFLAVTFIKQTVLIGVFVAISINVTNNVGLLRIE